jgi:hypothetical protein
MNNTGNLKDERSRESYIKTPTNDKMALKTLNWQAFDQLKAKHPDIRPEWLPRPGYKDKTANQLTQSIIAWIRLQGQQAERIAVTGRMIDRRKVVTDSMGFRRQIGSTEWIKSSMQQGTADISSTIRGRSVKIEVKIQHDKQSAAQRTYQHQVEASGGLYYIAKDFQSFYQWYCENFK